MRLLKPVDYKLKLHLIINTSSMLEFQLRKHNKSCIGITWRDLIMEAEVFDRSASIDRLSFLWSRDPISTPKSTAIC